MSKESLKPIWKRKIRITDKNEKLIAIPPQIPIDTDYLYITVEDGKIILSPSEES